MKYLLVKDKEGVPDLDATFARLNEEAEVPATIDKKSVKAEMVKTDGLDESPASMLNKLADFEIMKIPVGTAVGAGFAAVFATELIDGFLIKQTTQIKGMVKIGAAAAIAGFGRKYIGNKLALAAALLMTFDAIRDLTPLDAWAAKGASKISGFLPKAGLADVSNRRADVQIQANRVQQDYYASAEGRR